MDLHIRLQIIYITESFYALLNEMWREKEKTPVESVLGLQTIVRHQSQCKESPKDLYAREEFLVTYNGNLK